jgi:hypothetical protein
VIIHNEQLSAGMRSSRLVGLIKVKFLNGHMVHLIKPQGCLGEPETLLVKIKTAYIVNASNWQFRF